MWATFSQKVLKWISQHFNCIITHPMCTRVTIWLLIWSVNDNFVEVQKITVKQLSHFAQRTIIIANLRLTKFGGWKNDYSLLYKFLKIFFKKLHSKFMLAPFKYFLSTGIFWYQQKYQNLQYTVNQLLVAVTSFRDLLSIN